MTRCKASDDRYRKVDRQRKREYINTIRDSGCLLCGCHDKLEFHHFNPYTKNYDVAKLHTNSWKQLHEETPKCWVLCRECHNKLHLGVLCVFPELYEEKS